MKDSVLLIGHPDGYDQFLDYILERFFVVWVRNEENTYKKNETLKEVKLDLIKDYDNSIIEIKKLHKKYNFKAVLTHHEFYQLAKSKICKELGLKSASSESIKNATHKYFMKKCFEENNISTAKFIALDVKAKFTNEIETIESKLQYPMVVKPCNGMGSMGVRKVYNRDELKKAVRVARQIAVNVRSSSSTDETNKFIILEEYIDGEEFTVDGFVINGQWVPMISCSKYPPLTGPTFQENVYYFNCSGEDKIPKDLLKLSEEVVKALNVGDGPYHIEIRRENNTKKCYVVEAAPRMAGMGSTFFNLMYYSTGVNLYEVFVNQCLGINVEKPVIEYKNCTLEYDSFAKKGGIITNFKNIDKVIEHPLLVHKEIFKKVGEYIGGPGLNPETSAVFYFKTNSQEESESIVNWIEDVFEIETKGE